MRSEVQKRLVGKVNLFFGRSVLSSCGIDVVLMGWFMSKPVILFVGDMVAEGIIDGFCKEEACGPIFRWSSV
jgi:hypothetical protein